MFVIVFAAILGSAATLLALVPFGWGVALAAAPVGGGIVGLLAGVVIARLASTGRASSDVRWANGRPARQAGSSR